MPDVLLFTPGLDSYLTDKFLESKNRKVRRVYFNIHSRYSEHELEFLRTWYDPGYLDIIDIMSLQQYEKEDAYIPNRNLLLLTFAQGIYDADTIWINGVKDDRVRDNTNRFRGLAEEVLTESAGKPVVINSLLGDVEKAKAVYEFCKLYNNQPDQILKLMSHTFSCYSETLYEDQDLPYFGKTADGYSEIGKTNVYGCMECPACFRRMCALTAANLYVPFYDFQLVKDYKFSDLDANEYPERVKSIGKYYEFMEWCGCD